MNRKVKIISGYTAHWYSSKETNPIWIKKVESELGTKVKDALIKSGQRQDLQVDDILYHTGDVEGFCILHSLNWGAVYVFSAIPGEGWEYVEENSNLSPIEYIAYGLQSAKQYGMLKPDSVPRPTDLIPIGTLVRNTHTKETGTVTEKRWKLYGVTLTGTQQVVLFEGRFLEEITKEELNFSQNNPA